MESKNTLIIVLFLALLYIFLPIIEERRNENIEIYIDKETGVEYIIFNNSITPRLDKNGKIIVKNKTL